MEVESNTRAHAFLLTFLAFFAFTFNRESLVPEAAAEEKKSE